MNEKEMIEEMAFDLIKATSPLGVKDLTEVFDYRKVATDLYNLWNWRKPLEGSVVLSKEKYINGSKSYSNATLKSWKKEDLIEHIRILEHNWASAEKCIDNQAKNYEMLLNQTRKETAKEILQELYCFPHEYHEKKILELAKHYGVEVEE